MSRIQIQNAAFAYREKDVWSGVNLEVAEGETICLLGPNGCGKTTLLNCIHGDLRLKEGAILVDGADVRGLGVRKIARQMGYVFQEHSAPFPYSVAEVVRMGRGPHLGLFESPSRSDREVAERAMEAMGILHLRGKRYTEISGGERQLVLIARTLCQEPEIILLDEPTSHLDFKNQALVLGKIALLAQQGMTVIMTSHFPNHAWLFSGRVALMSGGALLTVGPSTEVMTEENLSRTYGIAVRVHTVLEGDAVVQFCSVGSPRREPSSLATMPPSSFPAVCHRLLVMGSSSR